MHESRIKKRVGSCAKGNDEVGTKDDSTRDLFFGVEPKNFGKTTVVSSHLLIKGKTDGPDTLWVDAAEAAEGGVENKRTSVLPGRCVQVADSLRDRMPSRWAWVERPKFWGRSC